MCCPSRCRRRCGARNREAGPNKTIHISNRHKNKQKQKQIMSARVACKGEVPYGKKSGANQPPPPSPTRHSPRQRGLQVLGLYLSVSDCQPSTQADTGGWWGPKGSKGSWPASKLLSAIRCLPTSPLIRAASRAQLASMHGAGLPMYIPTVCGAQTIKAEQ